MSKIYIKRENIQCDNMNICKKFQKQQKKKEYITCCLTCKNKERNVHFMYNKKEKVNIKTLLFGKFKRKVKKKCKPESLPKLIVIYGKSGTGKDTIFNKLKKVFELNSKIHFLVPCTTRPMREGEVPGLSYNYYTEEHMMELVSSGSIIEKRSYDVVNPDGSGTHVTWIYGTELPELQPNHVYILIGTLDTIRNLEHLEKECPVHSIYITVPDDERLIRTVNRVKETDKNYAEVCRRFLSDEDDFSRKKLNEYSNESPSTNAKYQVNNLDLDIAVTEISLIIKQLYQQ